METKEFSEVMAEREAERVKSYTIQPGATIDTGISGIRLLSVTALSLTGVGLLIFTSANSVIHRISLHNSILAINSESATHLLVYRDSNTSRIFIKNNHGSNAITCEVRVYD